MIISMVIFCSISHVYAQSPQKIEQELLRSFKRLQQLALYNEASPVNGRIDSIRQANTAFTNGLLAFTASARATFTYEFKELEKEGLIIKSAEDGLFRIYSWDTGTEHRFDAVYQYRVNNEVFSQLAQRDEQAAGKWYSNIYTLKTETKTWYIGLYNETHSSTEYTQGVKGFSIEDKDLNESVRLFKTAGGLKNEMGFDYNFLSVGNRPERPPKLIYYDTDDDKLHLTVVQKDGKVTREIITYQFTGKYFEQVQNR
jgi:hypothetical protein